MGSMVCLFGADGSGKTTLSKHVASYLNGSGVSATVVWMRGTHTLASILARFLNHFNTFRGPCNPYYSICVPPRLGRLWVWVEFLSILPVILSRFILPKFSRDVVIAERSLIDFLIWLIITLRWGGVVRSFVGKVISSLTYSLCDELIYVRADLSTLMSRRRGSGEERLIPAELGVYDAIAEALNAKCVDTSGKPVYESVKEVLSLVGVSDE